MRYLIFFVLVGISKLTFGQLNPPKNAIYIIHYHWPSTPIYTYDLKWNAPDSSLTFTLIGYKIYRCGDSIAYINNPIQTSYSGPESSTSCPTSPGTVTYIITAIYTNPNGNRESDSSCTVSNSAWPIGIKEEFKKNNFIEKYPIPFIESITIEIETGIKLQDATLEMFDVFGRKVRELKVTKNTFQIERENLPGGIYFYKIISENKIIGTDKLVAE